MLANDANSLIWWDWIGRHRELIVERTVEHLQLTGIAVGVGLVLTLALAALAQRWRFLRSPLTWISTWLYTIPSLAVFGFLIPITGASLLTAEIALVAYSLFILLGNLLDGLGAVPRSVQGAADGLGFRPMQRFVRVDLPMALPSLLTGLRLATVSTIALVTITFQVGYGGFGALIDQGMKRDNFSTEILLGGFLALAAALVTDRILAVAGRLLTPWTRGGTR